MAAAQDHADTPTPGALRAWMELSRYSNLPTVWSNVVAGMVWGWHASIVVYREGPNSIIMRDVASLTTALNNAFMLLVGASLIYTAGMIHNDAADVAVDQNERPGRPIPSGRVSRRAAWAVGTVMLALGGLCMLVYAGSPWTLPLTGLLIALVVAYNAVHTRWAESVVFLALCRSVLVWMAALTVAGGAWGPTWIGTLHAAAVGVYVLMVSLLARGEVLQGRGHLIGPMLAGIAVLDGVLLAGVGQWPTAWFCWGCAGLTLLLQKVVPGT